MTYADIGEFRIDEVMYNALQRMGTEARQGLEKLYKAREVRETRVLS